MVDDEADPLLKPSDSFGEGFCWPQAERKVPKAIIITILLVFAKAIDFVRLATSASLHLDSTRQEILLVVSRPCAILREMRNQVFGGRILVQATFGVNRKHKFQVKEKPIGFGPSLQLTGIKTGR